MPVALVHSTANKSEHRGVSAPAVTATPPSHQTATDSRNGLNMNQQLEESIDFSPYSPEITNALPARTDVPVSPISSTPKQSVSSQANPAHPRSMAASTARKALSLQLRNLTTSNKPDDSSLGPPPPPRSKQSWLLRLFESKLFDMSLAITYLFNSKEQGVQIYIGMTH